MSEPSVEFQYPDEPRDADMERERLAVMADGMRVLRDFIAEASNPGLRFAALQYLENPKERTQQEIAKALGCCRMTLHRELTRLKRMRALTCYMRLQS